ncbi:hypothetical protein GCM10022631_01330 [Deinococcus rubellus]|uniref:Cytochrome c oxidase subunit 2A n=1 Tax=Deinococcus rubellus TaxID=1889240 RepID=A0ABY5YN76_9DEIO|nr:cytochrome c oxidase subunit 2A [Deinococcus rubellus]UWX65532.1 cytochrome c oxidase subunit 2A [Deinococcus rubellus]
MPGPLLENRVSAVSRGAHSSQGGQKPRRGSGPYGTWVVIAVLVLTILMMWFLVLGILEARA